MLIATGLRSNPDSARTLTVGPTDRTYMLWDRDGGLKISSKYKMKQLFTSIFRRSSKLLVPKGLDWLL